MCKATNKLIKTIKSYVTPVNRRSASVFEIAAKYEALDKMLGITSPEDVHVLIKDYIFEDQEHFCVLFLDAQNHVIGMNEISCGLVNQTPIHPREAFREAISMNAVSVIFFHNHPSGSKTPSQEDIKITRTLVAAGRILCIPVLDHVIVAKGGFTSMSRVHDDIFRAE